MFTTYDEILLFSKANPNQLIIIDFKAQWCAPCKTIKPYFDYLTLNYPSVNFIEIDIEDESTINITENFDIPKLPTFIYIKNGSICHTFTGINKEHIENAINDYL